MIIRFILIVFVIQIFFIQSVCANSIYGFTLEQQKSLIQESLKRSNIQIDITTPGGSSIPSIFIPENPDKMSNYKLGPGDVFEIHIWDKDLNLDYSFVVNPEGKIYFPRLGNINVNNLSVKQFEEFITKKIRIKQASALVSVILKQTRSLKIFITGYVQKPGVYIVPIETRLSEALKLSGGINENGSLRNIKVISNKKENVFDLYKFAFFGNLAQNPILKSGDQIYVPAIKQKIAFLGQFIRPGIYEFSDSDSLEDLIELTGGFKENAGLKETLIWRGGLYGKNSNLEIIDLTVFINELDKLQITNGDILFIPSYKSPIDKNVVYIYGQITKPGELPYQVGSCLTDYIKFAGGTTNIANLNEVIITRFQRNQSEVIKVNIEDILYKGDKDKDIVIKPNDIIYIPEKFFIFRNVNDVINLILAGLGIVSLIINLSK